MFNSRLVKLIVIEFVNFPLKFCHYITALIIPNRHLVQSKGDLQIRYRNKDCGISVMATNLTKSGGYIQSNANVQVIFRSLFYSLPHLVLSSSQKHPYGRLLGVSPPIFNSRNVQAPRPHPPIITPL